jgi:hypothetical protein
MPFTQDTTEQLFKAKDKLFAYGLIEKHNEYSWKLTQEGHRAIEIGGFEKWIKAQEPKKGKYLILSWILKFLWLIIVGVIIGLIVLAIEYKWFNT